MKPVALGRLFYFMADNCPQTSWTQEVPPTTPWIFDGCLARIITAPTTISAIMDDTIALMDDASITMDN